MELEQGWYAMNCGCHAHILTSIVASKLLRDAAEVCPISGLPGLVPIKVVENLEVGR
jgi:hypothetical protein